MPIEPIKNSVANPVIPGKTAKKDVIDLKPQTSSSTAVSDDIVSLTAMPQGLKQSAEVDAQAMALNESRIAKIKAAIQDGSYVVDHERLAKKMLQFELNFPDTT